MIYLSDNFNSYFYKDIKYAEFDKKTTYAKRDQKVIGEKLMVTLDDYTNKNNTFISFFQDLDKKAKKNKDDLIISIKKEGDNYLAQTGNYVGRFSYNNLDIEIYSRFSRVFLTRMLNFANDIYLDDVNVADVETKDLDVSKFIIYYLFIQNLEKAFLLGLPKAYKSIRHHDMKLRGTIDINRFIKHDIPFKGKISSVSREQKEIQEIIDVLHKAVMIIEHSDFSTKNISHIKTHLKQNRSKNFVSNQTINKALNSKALQNPIFTPYKKVLKYAKFIINGSNIEESAKDNKDNHGFLINIAELFEIYVTKLLQKEFTDWNISSPKIDLYENKFYQRKIIPDIVMQKDNKIMVFDTKYKRMNFRGKDLKGAGDLDRSDFFQIHTYASYYQNKKIQDKNNPSLICAGLLYPIEAEFDKNKCVSNNLLGNPDCKFIVDGIDLSTLKEHESNESKLKELTKTEDMFIQRIRDISGNLEETT